MFKKLKSYDEIVIALINDGYMLKALNFAQEYGIHSMKLATFKEMVDKLKNEGKSKDADTITKRLQEIKKVNLLS